MDRINSLWSCDSYSIPYMHDKTPSFLDNSESLSDLLAQIKTIAKWANSDVNLVALDELTTAYFHPCA